jgi:hypothetical protein
MDFEEMNAWHGGYMFGDLRILRPMSVSYALRNGQIGSLWPQAEASESLKAYMEMDFGCLRETVVQLLENPGSTRKIRTTTFSNDPHNLSSADDVLTLLVHLGYLGCDINTSEVFIPNKEALQAFKDSTSDPVWAGLIQMHALSKELLEDTFNMDSGNVAKVIDMAHQKMLPAKSRNSEEALSCVISWAYIHANAFYSKHLGQDLRLGYIYAFYLPKPGNLTLPALLIEMKCNRSKAAKKQLIAKDYADKAKENGCRKILLVGIKCSERTMRHTCKIQEFSV